MRARDEDRFDDPVLWAAREADHDRPLELQRELDDEADRLAGHFPGPAGPDALAHDLAQRRLEARCS